MSVLHLLGTAGEGGAETYFVDLLKALKRAGVPEAAAIRGNPTREAQLKTAGVETDDGRPAPWKRFFVRDPFGNRIEIHEPGGLRG